MLLKGFSASLEFSDEKKRCIAGRSGLLVSARDVSHKLVCSAAKECVRALGEVERWRGEIARLYSAYKVDGFQEHEVRISLYFAPCRGTVYLHETLGTILLDVTVECRGEYSPLQAARETILTLKRLMEKPIYTMRDVREDLPLAPLAAEGAVIDEVYYRGTRGDMRIVHDVGMKWRLEVG